MAQKGCLSRLQKEYKALLQEPVPHIQAHPTPSNLLEWHFVLEGAKGTDFDRGVYHGKLVFPPTYPFKPPSISIFTPNGRFATNTKLCLSITDYHPESWNPMWSVGTILTGLLSFMYDNQPTTGSITTCKAEKQRLAGESLGFNVRNPTFRKLFPDWVDEHQCRATAAAAAAQQAEEQQQQQQQQQSEPTAVGGGDAFLRRQRGGAGGGASAAGGAAAGAAPAGSSLLTVAMLVLVLAIAAVPLFSTDTGISLGPLAERLGRLHGGSGGASGGAPP